MPLGNANCGSIHVAAPALMHVSHDRALTDSFNDVDSGAWSVIGKTGNAYEEALQSPVLTTRKERATLRQATEVESLDYSQNNTSDIEIHRNFLFRARPCNKA